MLYIRVLVLEHIIVKIAGLDEILPPKSFGVKNFIQQHYYNGPTPDAIIIINKMVPGLATIAHPLRTLLKLHVSLRW